LTGIVELIGILPPSPVETLSILKSSAESSRTVSLRGLIACRGPIVSAFNGVGVGAGLALGTSAGNSARIFDGS